MEKLIEACNAAKHILFITGAGISAASGLPTYRGVGGLYAGRTLLPPEFIMSKWAWKWMPSLVWSHLHKGYKCSKNVEPNIAHDSLVLMEALVDQITVVTQNVDGLHRKAGSSNVIELHGSADMLECRNCGYKNTELNIDTLPALPTCPLCDIPIRPPVVLFGEMLPSQAVVDLERAIMSNPDVVIAVGTTGNFEYVLEPMRVAHKRGKITAVIDPKISPTLAPYAKMWINEKAEDALPYLASKLTPS